MIKFKTAVIIGLMLVSFVGMAQEKNNEILAAQYYQSGDFEKAAVLYQNLFNKSKSPIYYEPLITSLLKLKLYDEAEKVARKQHKIDPENAMYSIDIGKIYQERGQAEKAAEWYNNILNDLPKNEFIIRDLANNFYRIEAYDYAIKAFVNGRKILKNESAFAFDLISLYRYRKDKVMLIYEYMNVLSTNPEILNQAENILSSTLEDNDDYDILKNSLLKRIQKDPQNLVYTELLTWQYIQQKEFDSALRQTVALDRRFKEEGERVYELAALLIENKAYDQAIEALNYLLKKGTSNKYYIPAKINILSSQNKLVVAGTFSKQDLLSLEKGYKDLLNEFGENLNTAFAIRQLANLQAFYLDNTDSAEALLERLLAIPNLSASIVGQTKLDLGDIYILSGEMWEAALIYGQLEKQFANEPFGQEAKFRNSKLSYYQADFTWAKAQLDILKGSTSQLIANDAMNLSLLISDNLQTAADTQALKKIALADLYIFKNQQEKALLILDSIQQKFPSSPLIDDIMMNRAKIFLKKNSYQESINELKKIIENYSFDIWADDAIFMMGDIYETKLNDPVKASQFYQQLITDFPGSVLVTEARKRFRNLRGDKLG
ncbi:MAG: hypothetical protein JWN56_1720 [Sphingobacteriales bacterium]|nr:hypothetical protein [Sphingobacteriales bacterium]